MATNKKPAVPIRRYLSRAVRTNYLFRVLSVLIAVGLLLWVSVYVGAKWALTNPPYGHSVVAYHFAVVFFALIILKYWAWPRIRRPLTLSGMASRLERGDPNLNECLSSALEFSEPDPLLEQSIGPSDRILEGFYQDAVERVRKRKRTRWVVPMYFWPLLAVMGVFAVFWTFLPRFEIFTGQDAWNQYRLFFWSNPYRPLHSLVVQPGFSDSLTGESVKVRADLLGPGYFSGSITYNMEGFPEELAEMKTVEGAVNSFEFNFENLQSDLRYKVRVGPLESTEYHVKVSAPAELTSIQLTYRYPVFMGGRTEVVPPGQGAAMAPMGTTVELTTRWSRPMESVSISVNGGEATAFSETASYWRGSFVLEAGGSYTLSGASKDGVPLRGNLEFPIQALVDLPPTVVWLFPMEDIDFSSKKPKGRIPLRFKIQDDFGIESVFLYSGAPGIATQTHQISQLDGKVKEVESSFLFDWRSWQSQPVVRVYIEAVDNHPDIAGKERSETRRFFFEPPGSFSEIEGATQEERIEIDPFELIALRIFYLLQMQSAQNELAESESETPPDQFDQWTKRQSQLVQLTVQTALTALEESDRLKRGPAPASGAVPTDASGEALNPTDPGVVQDVTVRMQQVSERLGGTKKGVDQLLVTPPPQGNTVVERQARQLDSAKTGYRRRANEEGSRAVAELAKAYEDLTGRKPPMNIEVIEEDMIEEQAKAGEDVGDATDKLVISDGDGKEGERGVTRKPKDGKEGSGLVLEGKGNLPNELTLAKEEEAQFGVGESDTNTDDADDALGTGTEVIGALGGPSVPTNEYAPSEYTLDPSTVHLDSAQARMMNRALSAQMAGEDLQDYARRPIPAEYEKAAEEYSQVLLGE